MCTNFERFIIEEEEEIVERKKTLRELRENNEISIRLYNALRRCHYYWISDYKSVINRFYIFGDTEYCYGDNRNDFMIKYEEAKYVDYDTDTGDYTPKELYDMMGEKYIMKCRNVGKVLMAELKSLI